MAHTDSESGAEVSDVEEISEEEEDEKQLLLLQQASAEDEPQSATCGRGLPFWGPPQGRNTCSSFRQSSKRCEKK
jgi:hypothetical protein